jgi:hypothetical protein
MRAAAGRPCWLLRITAPGRANVNQVANSHGDHRQCETEVLHRIYPSREAQDRPCTQGYRSGHDDPQARQPYGHDLRQRDHERQCDVDEPVRIAGRGRRQPQARPEGGLEPTSGFASKLIGAPFRLNNVAAKLPQDGGSDERAGDEWVLVSFHGTDRAEGLQKCTHPLQRGGAPR